MSDVIDKIQRMRSPTKLLRIYAAVKGRLEALDVSSSRTDPVGHYAEFLVKEHYGGRRTSNGTPGHDVVTDEGLRIEVKGRVARNESYVPKTYINDSNVGGGNFDLLVYIVFDPEDYSVLRAYEIPLDVFKTVATFVVQKGVRKWRFLADPRLFEIPGVVDLTGALRG